VFESAHQNHNIIGGNNEQHHNLNNIKPFTNQCFDRENDKASRIVKGILGAKGKENRICIGKDKKLVFWIRVFHIMI
jgi:hypothetical protein